MLLDAQVQREREVTARIEARSAETVNSDDAILRLSLAFGGDTSSGSRGPCTAMPKPRYPFAMTTKHGF